MVEFKKKKERTFKVDLNKIRKKFYPQPPNSYIYNKD